MGIGKRNILSRIILVLLVFIVRRVDAQPSPFDPVLSEEASSIREHVVVYTDRSLYITGEKVRFRGVIGQEGLPEYLSWSTVLYVELVSVSGSQVAGGKYPLINRVSAGEVAIPGDLLTGIYYLRCYTRWMRNWGQGFYCYLPLRILNPEKPEAEEREGGEAAVDLKVEKAMEKGFFEFSNCPPVLDRGDTVSMVIHVSQDYPFMEAEGCLTVVPLIAAPRPGMKVLQQTGEPANEAFRVKFLPDLNGVSVSGTVIEKGKADRAFSGQKIHMTLLGSRSDYLVSQIDEYGRFTVSLPQRHGNLELFVQPEDPGNSVTDIRIDQDFDPAQLYPPSKGFNIPDSQLQMITIMARNAQLSRIYSDQKPA